MMASATSRSPMKVMLILNHEKVALLTHRELDLEEKNVGRKFAEIKEGKQTKIIKKLGCLC